MNLAVRAFHIKNVTKSRLIRDEIFGVKCNTKDLDLYLPGIDANLGPSAPCKFNLSVISPIDMEFQAGDVFFSNITIRIELLFQNLICDKECFQLDFSLDQVIFSFTSKFGLYNFELKNFIISQCSSKNAKNMRINDANIL